MAQQRDDSIARSQTRVCWSPSGYTPKTKQSKHSDLDSEALQQDYELQISANVESESSTIDRKWTNLELLSVLEFVIDRNLWRAKISDEIWEECGDYVRHKAGPGEKHTGITVRQSHDSIIMSIITVFWPEL